jgi:hypothetical protein
MLKFAPISWQKSTVKETGMLRSRILAVLLLFALIVPLTGTTFLTNTPAATAQEMPTLGDPPVPPDETGVRQDTGEFRSAAAPLSVDTSNREAVRTFFNQYYVDVPASDNNWNGSLETCNAGTTSQAYKDAVSLRINFFRAMAGVPAGTGISNVTSAKAQQAALMMNANFKLNHGPTPDWKCYTAVGAEAAGSSNLAYGYGPYGWYVIDMYIKDPGANNTQVGHRASVLHPQTQLFGLGDTRSYNALWVFDEHYWDSRPPTREPFVAWPPKGFVPYPVVYPRWSFDYPNADFANATVTMMSNGASVPVAIESQGGSRIVWNPVGISFPDPNSPFAEPFGGEQTFTVTIKNVSLNGQSRSFAYDVTVIDPAKVGSNVNASLSATRGIPQSHVTASVSGFGKNTSVPVKWGNTMLTTITTNNSGSGSGTFKVPYAQMGVYPIIFGAGGGPLTKSFEVIPRIKLTPDSGAPGDTVDVSLRGFKARETVRIRWKQGSSWVEVARATTSNTGSANINVKTPAWAPAGANSVRGDSTVATGGRAQTNAFTVEAFQSGTMALSANRGTVNTRLTAALSDFPANTAVTLTFPGFYEATATGTTDGAGTATLQLHIPATPLGVYTVTAKGGGTQATGTYEVVPRIKLVPETAARGAIVNVSLRGYGAKEVVRIRWKQGSSWSELTRVTTSSSGSANIDIAVPSWAKDGATSVRGDAVSVDGGRAQTNAFTVDGGQLTSADASASTPTPEADPSVNAVWMPFVDDFEHAALDQWTDVDGISVQGGDARDGVSAAVATSSGAPAVARATLSVPQPELYVRASFKLVAQGDNPVRLLQLRSAADTPVMEASLDAASRLVITNTLTGRQATGPVVDTGEWHDLQLHVRIGNENGVIDVWLDGKRLADLSGNDTLGIDPLASLLIGDDALGHSFTVLFDSIGVDLHCLDSCPATVEPAREVTPEATAPAEPAMESTEETATSTPEPTEEIATPTPELTNTPELEPTASSDAEPTDLSDEPPSDEALASDEEMNQD